MQWLVDMYLCCVVIRAPTGGGPLQLLGDGASKPARICVPEAHACVALLYMSVSWSM